MIFQFDDRLKQNFENHRLRTARPVVKAFLIIVGLVNLLLLIPDCINATSETIRLIVALRVGYALLTVAFYLLLKRFTTFRSLAIGITLMEAIAVAQFLLVFASYPSPNFMIQLLGMIVLVVFLFFAPNYWPLMLGITLSGSAAFILMAYGIFAHDPAVQLVPGMVYLGLVVLIGAVFAKHSLNVQKRGHLKLAQLEYACKVDPLTKTGNRNMLEHATQWIEKIVNCGRKVSLVVMDVDNLKQANDEHGHVFGDAFLVEITNITCSHLRKEDICIRWGGDEFILLLPDTELDAAKKVTERIRQAISAHTFENKVRLSCSFGIAVSKPGQSLEELIKEADASMYKAKKGGKNTIVSSASEGTETEC